MFKRIYIQGDKMIGIDCNVKLSYSTAKKIKQDGYDFAMRYVGRYVMASHDIDIKEKNNILMAGLDLGLVQHCPGRPGIIPSKELGIEYGTNAREFSKQVEYDKDCIVYLDLEDVNHAYSKKQQLIYDFVNYWIDQVQKYYTPGVYIGFNNYMTSDQLYYKLKLKDYWRSFSWVPDVSVRGYAMCQSAHPAIHGISIDKNIVSPDKFGRTPNFMKGKAIFDPKEEIRDAARNILVKELGLGFDYWDNIKYFDELLYKLGTLFDKWDKF